MIALGVGFASRCTENELAAVVMAVLEEVPGLLDAHAGVARLAAPAHKRPAGLLEPVAGRVGLSPVYVTRDQLSAWQPATVTRSRLAEAAVGLPAVAEAAALAAAGPGARLLIPRRTAGPATCALALTDADHWITETP
ncbi:cobalt-precorrin 5A hydrolase [Aquisalimonas asiatica]|uniref:Cobalt-precorrin 5A hydrolase n=1 Tax=Aquisalimonas asiatica TaxID=406100 RepID=A0A1H8U992_9GAMM|nr:cobalt-precorrin 5A hydrolase [Aquisalimonas asiatica]